jgi:hypothetical protein
MKLGVVAFMIKATGIVSVILVASTTALAQGNSTQSAPQGAHPPQVLGQTGTMYDGNNANLQLPPEPNRYWANLWAAPIPAENTGAAGAAAAAAAASSAGGPSGAGVQ